MTFPRSILVLVLACAGGACLARADELAIDDLMLQDPALTVPSVSLVFSPRLKTLWLAALERPDSETRRQAAGTISIAIHRGMKGLESTIPALREVLRSDRDPVVRRAAAQALVTLEALDSATDLAAAAEKDGVMMAVIVEPALAAWDYKPSRDRWLARLDEPGTPRALRMLALDALGKVRDPRAVERLATLVRRKDVDSQPRLAAARALGNIRDDGLADLAAEISGNGQSAQMLERLLAAMLLLRQSDTKAVELIKILAVDQEPSVAKLALDRLYALDVAAGRSIAKKSLQSPDAALRSTAAAMIVAQEDVEAIRLLRPLLADRNPSLRRNVAAKFAEFGLRLELQSVVIEEAMAMLADTPWRGLEQAALVLGTLDHKPAASRLVELLGHDRPEVLVSSAWALRKLQLLDTLPAALTHAKLVHEEKQAAGSPHFGRQLSQLFQLFGDLRYREAEPLLRQFVPKAPFDPNARMAACWALGLFYENQPENDLAAPFAARLADVAGIPLEYPEVRHMTAIGLGRMKAKKQLEALRSFAEGDTQYTIVGIACYWSVEQLTGEKPPAAEPRTSGVAGWFLEPTSN